MMRILFWLALLILVVFAIRSKLRAITPKQPDGGQASGGAPGEIEFMSCCAHCHVHFPASEAVRADGQEYCCPAHVRLPPQ